jgi:WD40 repeat protein
MASAMKRRVPFAGLIASLMAVALPVSANVSFEADVLPLLQKRCSACHFPPVEPLKGKLDLSTIDGIRKGGGEGAVIIPGKADESRLLLMVEGKLEPRMPPEGKGDPLTVEEVAKIREWINAGATGGAAPPDPAQAPAPTPSEPLPAAPELAEEPANKAPVAALAYSPPGAELFLARGGLHKVELFKVDPDTGVAVPKCVLDGHAEMVRALAFSPDGTLLAAAGGRPGRGGELKLWKVADQSLVRTIEGHKDNILDLAFSPDGKRIATASYDKTVAVWNVETGDRVLTLENHVDAVYAVAYSPDGSRIASGAGDRTVKIWDAESGALFITISDSLDAVLSLAFSPSGGQLAGAGADKMIRIWDKGDPSAPFQQTDVSAGKLRQSTFAHDGAVLKIDYSPDGSTIYSTSEDKRIKAWDAVTLTEKTTFEQQSDWVTSLAISPDGKYLAAGRYDSTSTVYAVDTGKPVSSAGSAQTRVADAEPAVTRKKVTSLSVEPVIIRATIPPAVNSISPDRWHRGSEIELAVSGKNLDGAVPYLTNPKVRAEQISTEAGAEPELKLGEGPRGTGADILDNARPYSVRLRLITEADAPLGRFELMFRTPRGMSNSAVFTIIAAPDAPEAEPNNTIEQAQPVTWPIVIIGQTNASGDVDRFKFSATAGQELVFALTDTGINAAMSLLDASGAVVATLNDAEDPEHRLLGHRFDTNGDYMIELSDAELRAGIGYRLHIGAFPYVSNVWPLGVAAGPPRSIQLTGYNLGTQSMQVDPPDEPDRRGRVPLPVPRVEGSPINLPSLALGAYPEVYEEELNDDAVTAQALEIPVTVNGRIDPGPGDTPDADCFRVKLAKGQTIIFETQAAELGSPLDSIIEALDTAGEPLQRATIRCVAETTLTLSGRDSRSGGLRLDNWRDLKINDYLMMGGEILKVRRIPGYADEDVLFQQYPNGQRVGYFATTPKHHAVNTVGYKVEIHQPGAQFAPNGKPVFPLYWRNDDGFTSEGNTTGDSCLEFTAPADAEYIVRVRDARGFGGPRFAYRLMLRAPEPAYDITAGPFRVNVPRQGAAPIDVRVLRRDGFSGPVSVRAEGMPAGYRIDPVTVRPDEDLIRLVLIPDNGAASTPLDSRFKVIAEADVGGVSVAREATIGPITLSAEQPDLVVKAAESVLEIAPGQSGSLSVALERFNGFESRVPLSVLNLPFGVSVMYTGLNGILVREGELDRKMEIYVEPWVEPVTRLIYVQAQIEATTPLKPVFLSLPIELRVAPKTRVAQNEPSA